MPARASSRSAHEDTMTTHVVRDHDRPLQEGGHPVKIDGANLLRHTRYVRSVLLKKGVRRRDLADMTQEVFLTAWRAMQEGRFCPRPGRDLGEALRYWLFGIAWREATDYRELRSLKSEVLRRTPIDRPIDTIPDEQLDARRVLDLFGRVRREDRELMFRVALGEELQAAAHEMGITPEAASARLRRGREAFTQIIFRWENYPHRIAHPPSS